MSEKDISTSTIQTQVLRQPSSEAIEMLSRMMAKRLIRLRDSLEREKHVNETGSSQTIKPILRVQTDWIEHG